MSKTSNGAFGTLLAAAIMAVLGAAAAVAAPERPIHVAIGDTARPPIGWVEFCNRHPTDCTARPSPARDVVLSPAPAAIAVPLGVDLGRAAFHGLRALAQRAGVSGLLEGVGQRIGRIEGLAAVERDVADWLGFDPLKLLSRLLSR